MAATLATIFPELATRLGDLPAGYTLPAEQARLRLFEAVGAFLATIATRAPVTLILDDLQWADSATLDLLCYIARPTHRPTRDDWQLPGERRSGACCLAACPHGPQPPARPDRRAAQRLCAGGDGGAGSTYPGWHRACGACHHAARAERRQPLLR